MVIGDYEFGEFIGIAFDQPDFPTYTNADLSFDPDLVNDTLLISVDSQPVIFVANTSTVDLSSLEVFML